MADNAVPSRRSKFATGLAYCAIAVIAGPPALMMICYLLFLTCMCCGWGIAFTRDHISGKPLQLERAVFLASPDRKTGFIAERDGTFRLVNLANGQVLQSHTYSPEDYTKIEAKWTDADHLELQLRVRYPALATGVSRRCSVKTGFSPD